MYRISRSEDCRGERLDQFSWDEGAALVLVGQEPLVVKLLDVLGTLLALALSDVLA